MTSAFHVLALIVLLGATRVSSQCLVNPAINGIPFEAGLTSCPSRFYCPNVTESVPPLLCPPTQNCSLTRVSGGLCPPQGYFEPIPCPEKYYCPTTDQKIVCPENHRCPTGSTSPLTCQPMSICPEMSATERFYGGIIVCVIMDVFLLTAYLLKSRVKLKRWNSVVEPLVDSKCANPLEVLQKGFSKCLSGKDTRLTIRMEKLGLSLSDTKQVILKDVSGEIQAGLITAIMGPSGAGKTSLVNVILARVARTNGNIYINNVDCDIRNLKKLIGYVPQNDTLLSELTVRECILHSARCRLPDTWSQAEINEYVDAIISVLELEAVKHVKIGNNSERGVSGGQRKRVNIGVELAAAPLAILLDEPTSGLDASVSMSIIQNLKTIAKKTGITIVVVIHQPRYEIFEAMDNLLLLAQGGMTAYWGSQAEATQYFEGLKFQFPKGINPADTMMDILCGQGTFIGRNSYSVKNQVVNKWKDRHNAASRKVSREISANQSLAKYLEYNNNPDLFKDEMRKTCSDRGASFLKQVWFCHNRAMVQQWRTWFSFFLEIFVCSSAGILMGTSTQGVITGLYQGILIKPFHRVSAAPVEWLMPLIGVLIPMAVSLAGAPSGVKIFSEEKTVFIREASSGHSKLAYYIGKVLANNHRLFLSALHFSGIFVFFSSPLTSFFDLYLVVLLFFFNVYGISIIVSIIVRRENASLLSVVVAATVSVMSGFGPKLHTIRDEYFLGWLWDLSYARWGAEALYGKELQYYIGLYQVEDVSQKLYGYAINRFGLNILYMLLSGFVFRAFGYFVLLRMNRK